MKKRSKKLPYEEGSWFAIPLEQGGYAVGCVARCTGKGPALGYFFGPKRAQVPSIDELASLAPKDAIKVMQFGDLGLIDGSWPVIGRFPDWDRTKWPIPIFYNDDPLVDVTWKVEYDDSLQEKEWVHIPFGSGPQKGYMHNVQSGSEAAEYHISQLLP